MSAQPPQQPLFQQLLADLTLDGACEWQAEATPKPANWTAFKEELRQRLEAGQYAFQPLHRIHGADGAVDRWDETDHLVLKAMALVLEGTLGRAISPRVYRRPADAGQAIQAVQAHLAGSPDTWVMQSDLAGAYARIDHDILYRQVATLIPGEQFLLRLVWQYLHHAVADGGEYLDVERGVDPGCALSPLMVALYLKPLDDLMASKGSCHVRCMDDGVTIFPTRWAAQKTQSEATAMLAKLGLDGESQTASSPESAHRTAIARADRGFDLLDCHVTPEGAVTGTAAMMDEPTTRLYAQSLSQARVEQYLSCWATEAPNAAMERASNRAPRSRLGWRTQAGLAAGLFTALPATVSAAVVNWGGGPLDIPDALGFPVGTLLDIDGDAANDIFLVDLAGNLSASFPSIGASSIGNPLAAGLQNTTFVVKNTQAFATFVSITDPGADGTYYLPFLGLTSCPTCLGYLSLSYAGGNWGLNDAFWNNTPGAPITVGDTPPVPEPAPFGLLLGSAALVALGGISRRRKKSRGEMEVSPSGMPVAVG